MNERVVNRKAFVSHSHSDHPTAKALATALRVHGVESWLDEWELLPGDSLMQKIFQEGLRECGVFLVLLSQTSVTSRWVREELDVALIRRIEGSARVIPVRIEPCEMPVALTALFWLDVSTGVETVAQKVADVIFGVRNVPPVAPPPSLLTFDIPGLTPLAARVAVHLFGGTDGPPPNPPQFDGEELVSALSLRAEEVNDAIDELEEKRCIRVHRAIGTSPFGFVVAIPVYRLAFQLRGTSAIGYDPEMDVKKAANALVSHENVDGEQLAEATGLPPSRVNAAVQYLEDERLVKVYRAIGGGPWRTIHVRSGQRHQRDTAVRCQECSIGCGT